MMPRSAMKSVALGNPFGNSRGKREERVVYNQFKRALSEPP
jgi:hypothetical protein